MDKNNNEEVVNKDEILDISLVENFTHKSQNWCGTGILSKVDNMAHLKSNVDF